MPGHNSRVCNSTYLLEPKQDHRAPWLLLKSLARNLMSRTDLIRIPTFHQIINLSIPSHNQSEVVLPSPRNHITRSNRSFCVWFKSTRGAMILTRTCWFKYFVREFNRPKFILTPLLVQTLQSRRFWEPAGIFTISNLTVNFTTSRRETEWNRNSLCTLTSWLKSTSTEISWDCSVSPNMRLFQTTWLHSFSLRFFKMKWQASSQT